MTSTSCDEKIYEKSISRESRIKSFRKDISLIVLATLIAISATLFIEIVKMISEVYIPNKIGSTSATLIIFIIIIYVAMILIRKQIDRIAEMYDINKYKFSGEFAGENIDKKLESVKQFYKDLKGICNGKYLIRLSPILSTTKEKEIKKLTEQQKENLLLEKMSSLHLLDVALCDKDTENEIAKVRIEVIRLNDKINFFCLCNCDKSGEIVKKEFKDYFDKALVLQSFECNF